MVEYFEEVVNALDTIICTERKRHIVGGVLLSTALLFAGLAATVMAIKEKEKIK